MEVQEVDPTTLTDRLTFRTGDRPDRFRSERDVLRAEDVFANGLTRIAFDTLTKAFVLETDGLVSGYAGYRRDSNDGSINPHATGTTGPHAKIIVQVNPALRRQGIGTRLLHGLETAARQEGIQSFDCYPRLEPGVADFAIARGWREAYREVVQVAEAAQVPAQTTDAALIYDFVEGADCKEELAKRLYEVFQIASPEIAAYWSFSNFYADIQKPRRFNGFAYAHQDSLVIGFSWGLDAEPDAVFHEFTGVRPEWRGRRIATALKHEMAQAAVRAGLPCLLTCNRVGNHTIFSINERMGYRPVIEMALFQKQLSV